MIFLENKGRLEDIKRKPWYWSWGDKSLENCNTFLLIIAVNKSIVDAKPNKYGLQVSHEMSSKNCCKKKILYCSCIVVVLRLFGPLTIKPFDAGLENKALVLVLTKKSCLHHWIKACPLQLLHNLTSLVVTRHSQDIFQLFCSRCTAVHRSGH